jgi:hypothetical protein
MSNLLPELEKKNLRKQYLARIFSVFLLMLLITFVLASVYLLPSYFSSMDKARLTEERVVFLKSYSDKNKETNPDQILRETKEKLDILSKDSNLITISEAIKKIIQKRPLAIKLDAFAYRTISPTELSLSISGIAKNRDRLINFTDLLEEDRDFFEVKLPVSNLAPNKNIDFTIDITLNLESDV